MFTPDQTAVISLRQRSDRRAAQGSLKNLLGFDAPYVWAVDGDLIKPPPYWQTSPQSYANMMSHKAVLEHYSGGTIMVLEDDALVLPGFQAKMDTFMQLVPANWEALWLGGQHLRPTTPMAPGVARCKYTIRTHAYVLRGQAIETALEVIKTANRHWDNALAKKLDGRNGTYSPDPFLIGTTGMPSDIPDSDPLPKVSNKRV